MRVLIIGFFTRTYMPYIDKYEKCLKSANVEYDVAFFDRDCTLKDVLHVDNEYTYCHITKTSRLKKLIPVFCYIRLVKKLIKEHRYDKLIVLTTMPAVLLQSVLINEYSGRYIFDYRDTTYEQFGFFKKLVNKLVEHSSITVISSRGFLNILTANTKIMINHNISNVADAVSVVDDITVKNPIVIGFLGYLRYFDVNSILINQFKDKPNFRLLYVGTAFADCDLATYVKITGADNVEVRGKFNNMDKAKLYKNIDIINAMYSIKLLEVQYALPNKVYDVALFKKPIMTTKNTFLAEIVEKYKLGFSVDPFTDNIPDKVQEYLAHFDADEFLHACNTFLRIVNEDEQRLEQKIWEFIEC